MDNYNKHTYNSTKIVLEHKKEQLKSEKEWQKERMKMSKFIVISCSILLLILCIMTSWIIDLNGFNAFSIALLTVTGQYELRTWMNNSWEFKNKIKTLENEIHLLEMELEHLKNTLGDEVE